MDRRLKALEKLYSSLPKLECKKLCEESCGPILMEKIEWERIIKRVGEVPKMAEGSLNCPMLKDKLCSVYTIRPAICRLFGIVERMPCPHGCVPERWMTREEGHAFLNRVREISTLR